MSDLPKMLKELKFDKRMLNWNLRQKLLTEEEYQSHLKNLEDISHLQAEDVKEDSAKADDKEGDQK